MIKRYLCIDGGTTNTRIRLVVDGKIADSVKFSVGAKAGIDDKSLLKKAIKEGISTLLSRNELTKADITRILASGMITSEFGLVDLPHISTPAGIKELKSSLYETVLSEISDIPFVFVRGVRTCTDRLDRTDMMRGEETELMGIMHGEGVYVLPGSHTKIIEVKDDRITDFKTMLTGEMISALSGNTILKGSVDMTVSTTDEEYLIAGYRYAEEYGLNDGLFRVRILKNVFGANKTQVYSFFLGLILFDDIRYILSKNSSCITVGGNKAIKEALSLILSKVSDTNVKVVEDELVELSSALGAIKIFEMN